MKPLVIYHANCADGFGAAFAAWTVLGDEADYEPMQYGKLIPLDDFKHFVANRDVYMLDFSLPREYMEAMFEHADSAVWLDHHKTAFEMWLPGEFKKGDKFIDHARPNEKFILLDDNRSGAMLAWNYFHPMKDAPLWVRHIDDRDRWQFKMRGTKEFNAALFSYQPWSFSQWANLTDDEEYGTLIAEGAAILCAHEQNVRSVAKHAQQSRIWWRDYVAMPVQWEGHEAVQEHYGLAVNCPAHLSSDVGHQLANQSGTFGLCWYMDSEQVIRCSLRSNGDYDVSSIAKALGGGGHKNAAGFSTDVDTLMGWLK